MPSRARPRTPVSTPQTRAGLTLSENFDTLLHLITLGGREIKLVRADTKRLRTFIEKQGDLTAKGAAPKIAHSVERFTKTLQARIDRFQTATLWQVVLLVTCVEAYLQDVLSTAASVDPKLMGESEQRARYADVITATSLGDLANDLRVRWARGWLGDGGPTRWITSLKRMGARGYPDDLAPRLERIWGIRHVVVHRAGVASPEFCKRHPGVVAAAGDRVKVSAGTFGTHLESVGSFLRPTEQFFLARYPSLVAAPPDKVPAG